MTYPQPDCLIGAARRAGRGSSISVIYPAIGEPVTFYAGATDDDVADAVAAAEALEFYAEEGRRTYRRVIPARQPNGLLFNVQEPLGVIGDVPPSALIIREEPFGLIARPVAFDELDKAVSLANSAPFGLASYVIAEPAPNLRRLRREIRAGVSDSGWGHEGLPEGMAGYLQTRLINEC